MPPGGGGVPEAERLAQRTRWKPTRTGSQRDCAAFAVLCSAPAPAPAPAANVGLLRVPPFRTWFHTFRTPPGSAAFYRSRLRAAGMAEGPAGGFAPHAGRLPPLHGTETLNGMPLWRREADGDEGMVVVLFHRGGGHWMIGREGGGEGDAGDPGWVDSRHPLPAAAAATAAGGSWAERDLRARGESGK
eukprot:gene23035-44138_t